MDTQIQAGISFTRCYTSRCTEIIPVCLKFAVKYSESIEATAPRPNENAAVNGAAEFNQYAYNASQATTSQSDAGSQYAVGFGETATQF